MMHHQRSRQQLFQIIIHPTLSKLLLQITAPWPMQLRTALSNLPNMHTTCTMPVTNATIKQTTQLKLQKKIDKAYSRKSFHKCIQATSQLSMQNILWVYSESKLYSIQRALREQREYAENTPRTLREPSNHVPRRAIACFTQKGRIHRQRIVMHTVPDHPLWVLLFHICPLLAPFALIECGSMGTPCHVIRGLIKNWKYVTNIKSAGDGSTKNERERINRAKEGRKKRGQER